MDVNLFIKLDDLREGLGLPGAPRGTGGINTRMGLLTKGLLGLDRYHVVAVTNERFEYPGIEVHQNFQPINVPIVGGIARRWAEATKWSKYEVKRPGQEVVLFAKSLEEDEIAAARQAGCKLVFWVAADSLIDDSPLNKSMPWVARTRSLLPEMDLVIALTGHQAEMLKDGWGIDAPVVYGGVELPDETLLDTSQRYALWVGRPVPLKRPWLFVEMARSMPEHAFRMVLRRAKSDAHMIAYLEYEASNLGNLELVFDVSPSDMPAQYSGAVALVSTSASEGMSRVMLEAGAAGTEVLSLEIDTEAMLSTERWGFCAQGSYDALAGRLGKLLESGGSSREERLDARTYIETRFGVQNMVDGFVGAVDELLRRGRQ